MNTHGRFPNSTRIPPSLLYCLRIVLALSCGLLLARAAGQQIVTPADSKEQAPPGVSVAGVPIFSGVGNLDTWIAVRFEIQTDAVGVQGNIEASWLPFDAPAVTAARPVDLPPFSRQQFFLYCERIHAHCQMETGLRLPNGQLLGGQRFPAVSHYGAAPILIVGEEINPLRAARALFHNPDQQQPIQILESPLHLPDRFLGLTPFSGLLITSRNLAPVQDAQAQALLDWVLGGGNLALTPAAHNNLPRTLNDLLPLNQNPPPAAESPSFTDIPWGLGTIRLLHFDPFNPTPEPDAQAASTRLAAWMGIRPAFGLPSKLTATRYSGYGTPDIWPFSTTWARPLLRHRPIFYLPTANTLLVGTILYAILTGPLMYFLFGRKPQRTRQLFWILPLLWLTAGFAVAGSHALLRSSRLRLELVSIIQCFPNAPETGFCETTAVVMSPSRTTLHLQATGKDWFFLPFSTSSPSQSDGIPMQTDRALVQDIPMKYGEVKSFYGRQILSNALPRFQYSVTQDQIEIVGNAPPPGEILKLMALEPNGRSWHLQSPAPTEKDLPWLATGVPHTTGILSTIHRLPWEETLEHAALHMAQNLTQKDQAYLAVWSRSTSPPITIPNTTSAEITEHRLLLLPLSLQK